MTVLFDATLYMPEMVIRPDTRTVCDVPELSADLRADAVVTVTTVDVEPPGVPPLRLAKPTGLVSAAHTGVAVATARPLAARTPAERAERTVLRVDMGILRWGTDAARGGGNGVDGANLALGNGGPARGRIGGSGRTLQVSAFLG
ncbi:hypothetical protein Ait01nite_011590 [Actinoplanes italicus]|nr:hypothetical protein Ait01nite_011590 [Actinoplanes italicus]